MLKLNAVDKILCKHCHEEVMTAFHDEHENTFCCQGCLSVHTILKAGNLEKFYDIQEQTGDYTKPVDQIENAHFDYLNSKDFLHQYGQEKNGEWTMSFYLKGVHCLACLWLIEKLPQIVHSVKEARLNMGKSLVTISLKKGHSEFKEAAETLNKLGYSPFPISNQDELEKHKTKEERALLLKIGVAAFSMMNIMLYTGSVYAGADGAWFKSFGLLSFILALPVVLFSATPFYRSAFSALKGMRVNIDIPLSIAIILGFIISTVFMIQGKEYYYYDSIATLTFLILLSRFFLRKVQQTSLNKNDLVGIFQRGTFQRRLANQEFEHVLAHQIKEEDIIKVMPNQVFPCDGTIIEGKTRVNLSTLTGESQNISHPRGSNVFMGTLNISEPVLVKANKVGEQSRLGLLLKDLENQSKKESHYNYLTDRVSKYFVYGVLGLALITLIVTTFISGFEGALENALALIIVTCPCALGLATPLTFSRVMELGQKKGIIIKTDEALERVARSKNLIFDKTGTLTKGQYVVTKYTIDAPESFKNFQPEELAFSLEGKSSHPVAKAIVEWAKREGSYLNSLVFDFYEEILGYGIRAQYNGHSYEAYAADCPDGSTTVIITEDAKTILTFKLKDEIKADSKDCIHNLEKEGFGLYLFSGDKKSIVKEIGAKLGFKENNIRWEMKPEDKAREVAPIKDSLFIGDGANDSLAFHEADASIATHGSVEISLRVADIFLTQPNLHHVSEVLFLAQKAIRIVKTNLGFSIAYNLLGAGLAIAGLIGPLEAAVLMPLSSLTVLGITLIGTRERKEGQNGNT